MKIVILKAHFDGRQICLDEPSELLPGTKLMVAVVSTAPMDDERPAWLAALQSGLACAYGNDEPDYSNALQRY